MNFEELKEFERDKKKLGKKYKSILDDLETVKQVLEVIPNERPPFSFRINNLGIETCIIKVKKIACKALKGKGVNSGLRLVYAHFNTIITTPESKDDEEIEEKSINKVKIVFIELYHKSDKENEDRDRILKYFK